MISYTKLILLLVTLLHMMSGGHGMSRRRFPSSNTFGVSSRASRFQQVRQPSFNTFRVRSNSIDDDDDDDDDDSIESFSSRQRSNFGRFDQRSFGNSINQRSSGRQSFRANSNSRNSFVRNQFPRRLHNSRFSNTNSRRFSIRRDDDDDDDSFEDRRFF